MGGGREALNDKIIRWFERDSQTPILHIFEDMHTHIPRDLVKGSRGSKDKIIGWFVKDFQTLILRIFGDLHTHIP